MNQNDIYQKANDECSPSTKALSVFTVLSLAPKSLTAQEIREAMCAGEYPASESYVSTGIQFLAQRSFIERAGDRYTIPKRLEYKKLVRTLDQRDLMPQGGE